MGVTDGSTRVGALAWGGNEGHDVAVMEGTTWGHQRAAQHGGSGMGVINGDNEWRHDVGRDNWQGGDCMGVTRG